MKKVMELTTTGNINFSKPYFLSVIKEGMKKRKHKAFHLIFSCYRPFIRAFMFAEYLPNRLDIVILQVTITLIAE
jgi:hypothetical protein